jgi:hypothetical protein
VNVRLPLDAVIITEELDRRPPRAPDYEIEAKLGRFDGCDGERDRRSRSRPGVQELVRSREKQCRAGSAGVSLLEEGESAAVFRWRARLGGGRQFLGQTMPRAQSPCGIVLERNTALLMCLPSATSRTRARRPPSRSLDRSLPCREPADRKPSG